MAMIELWEKSGKGAVRFVHNLKPRVEVVALEDVRGNIFPIYDGHNEVPAGIYNTMFIRPYAKENEEVISRNHMMVEVEEKDDVIYLVNVGEFLGGYYPYKGDAWNKYVDKNGEILQRPVGWSARSAEKMLLEARNVL